jgi:hypothetical protein
MLRYRTAAPQRGRDEIGKGAEGRASREDEEEDHQSVSVPEKKKSRTPVVDSKREKRKCLRK